MVLLNLLAAIKWLYIQWNNQQAVIVPNFLPKFLSYPDTQYNLYSYIMNIKCTTIVKAIAWWALYNYNGYLQVRIP